MKKYIRLSNGQIYKWLENDKCWLGRPGIATNKDGSPYLKGCSVVAESDNYAHLIMDGDLLHTSNFDDIVVVKEIKKYPLNNLNNHDKWYTKQGDNYVLVWDKERGVI